MNILSNEDWNQLKRFILGHHKSDADIIQIFLHLYSQRHSIEQLNPPLKIWQNYFQKMSYKRFQNLNSDLNKHLEDFLILKEFRKNPLKRHLILNKIFNDEELFRKADQQSKRINKIILTESNLSLETAQIELELWHQQYYSDNPIKYKQGFVMLEKLIQDYLTLVQLKSFQYLSESINWGRIQDHDYKKELEILKITANINLDTPYTLYLKLLLELVKDRNVESFLKLRTELYKGQFKEKDELHTIITLYLIQSSIYFWQTKQYVDAKENAKLIEYGLSSGVYMRKGKIPVTRFHNIIATIGSLRSFEWTKDFIGRWKEDINIDPVESTVALATAQNAFSHNKLELIIPILRGHKFKFPLQKVIALTLELVGMYVERREYYSVLRNYIPNFKKTVKRNQKHIGPRTAKAHLNFIRIIELLIQNDFMKVSIRLDKFNPLIYRKWVDSELIRRKLKREEM